VADLTARRSGLILIVGPTGCGKSTLLASLIDRINRGAARHIVTLEDPVEYVHVSMRSLVAQSEVGRDVASFAEGIRGMLRADPDVIAIGELRDSETMQVALAAAETGHLVLASMHTADAAQAVERIVDAFPSHGRDGVRIQVAQTLSAVAALRLVRRAHGTGRRAVVELLIGTDAVRNLIREGKTHQLRSAMQTGRAAGMHTLEMHLAELLERGEIRLEDALSAASRPADLEASAR
jgi:twitching motility protein PilT